MTDVADIEQRAPGSKPEKVSKAAMAGWDLPKRLRRIQRIFVRHDHVLAVNTALDGGYDNGIRLRESVPAFLVGDSRCGKSELLKRFVSQKAGAPFPDKMPFGCVNVRGPSANIVYLDCYNGATPLQACTSMLGEIYDQRSPNRNWSQQRASHLLMKHFFDEKVDLLIIDEAQKMVDGRSPNDLANWIISLRNAGFFRIFISGDRSLRILIDTINVLRDSKKALIDLYPFAYRTDDQKAQFFKFLTGFEKDIPFVTTPLLDKNLTEAIYFATRGRPGTLAIFMETATEFAFRRVAKGNPKSLELPETLEISDLVLAFDQMMAGETRMHGINPFTHTGALPSYAKTHEEEAEELNRAFMSRKKGGPTRGGRLDD